MHRRTECHWSIVVGLAVLATAGLSAAETAPADKAPEFRGALLSADDVTVARLQQLQMQGWTDVVLLIQGTSPERQAANRRAAARVLASDLKLCYWIEVARCRELAETHPEWMASLQTHEQWRRFFPQTPRPAADEVAKTYPWVPILSREPFQAQLARVKKLLAEQPTPARVFLNDLQGAPSACGCGNPLCRWTSDYGNKRTTTPLGDDAATLFVKAVEAMTPDVAIVPVWTTECEAHDGAKDGLCAGVGCFKGICWQAYTKQLEPLQQSSETLAVLAPFREFQRDIPFYGEPAGWLRHVVQSFTEMPPQHGGKPIPASRLITVLQGWKVEPSEIDVQVGIARQLGVHGYIVAYQEVEQSWQPKLVRWR